MEHKSLFSEKRRRATALILLSALLFTSLGNVRAQPFSAPPAAIGKDYEIKLLAEQFTPEPGIDDQVRTRINARANTAVAGGSDKIHVLLQLATIPTDEEKAALAARGIHLLEYVPNYAWIAAIPAQDPTAILREPGVRWLGDWAAEDKLHPYIKADTWGEWAVHPTEDKVMVIMQLHKDVPLEQGAAIAEAHGGVALPPIEGVHGMTVWISKDNLLALAGEEAVLWIEEGPPPLSPTNDGVRESMNVNPLYSAPYNLSGNGVRIFVFDGGLIRATHTTFDAGSGSRVTQIEAGTVADHPTHVAGTAAGDGNGGRAQGVAPQATILSGEYERSGGTMLFWDNAGDIQADYATARGTYSADLGTNSIGSNTASNNYDCAHEGDYGVSSNMLDGIVRGDNTTVGSAVLMTWANGNERSGGTTYPGRCGSNYVTTAPPSCAKNPIHVGAINSDHDSMTSFSSWGPCDDGRLKPVISASGCQLGREYDDTETFIYSSLATGDNDFGGGGWCGTSMSTPAVAGVVALMMQEWRTQGYGGANDRPLPALFKAMLMHTARDLGQDGPDYAYGYGEVDAKAAVDLIRDGSGLSSAGPVNWGADSVTQGVTDTFTVDVPAGAAELKVSLAWDDYAAAAYAANALVNNLDLEVVAPNSSVYRPWILNPAAPYQAATAGVNNVDNQEQVVVANPAAGTWTIRVKGTTVPQGPQSYGLVYTSQAPTYDATSCTERVTNGGFESAGDWTLSGAARVTGQPHSGTYSLRLGGAISSNHTAYQEIALPASDDARIELSFWWYMTTAESPGHGYDKFYAEVRNTSDQVLGTFDFRSDGWQQSQWMKSENMDLTPWAGQTVRLYFYAFNNESNITTFWVDDVSLETCPPVLSAAPEHLSICAPADAVYTATVRQGIAGFTNPVTLSLSGVPAGASEAIGTNPVTPPGDSVMTIGPGTAAAGSYSIGVNAAYGGFTLMDTVLLDISTAAPGATTLTSPTDGSAGIATAATFTWTTATQALNYDIEIATDPGFSNIVVSATGIEGTSYTPGSPLNIDTVYYWRVGSNNGCGTATSTVSAFRTAAVPFCWEAVTDGGFENGPNQDWSESSAQGWTIVTTDRPRTGAYSAWLGGGNSENAQVWQTDAISSAATSATLTYWYEIDSGDICGWDYGYLRINSTAVYTYDLCSSTDTGGYVQSVAVDMLSYAGTSPEIRFQATTDPSLLSSLFVDDVTLEVCRPTTPITGDYSDLPGSYGVAWHTGSGALRLGSAWNTDSSFGDGADTSDDGITREASTPWVPGQSVTLYAQVTGGGGYLAGWFDWDDDGAFEPTEKAVAQNVNVGSNTIAFAVPTGAGYTTGRDLNARFRLYTSEPAIILAPMGSETPDGGADNGEVEDYTFTHTPTAISTVAILSQGSGLIALLVLGGIAFGLVLFARKRR